MLHIISWSGGKDSTASVILMKKHLKELTKPGDKVLVVFAEVMFDLKNKVSGHNPDIIKFIHRAQKIFTSWGFKCITLRAEKDFLDFFYHTMKRAVTHPEHVGMTYGFPGNGRCGVKRDLKLKPIDDFKKAMANEEHIDYVGIAIDEPERLAALHKQPNTVSLLEKYNYTEDDARKLCQRCNLLSPQYSLNNGKQKRDGCWFCPNAKMCEHLAIYEAYPEVWEQYVALEKTPNLAYDKWNCYTDETLEERSQKIKLMAMEQDNRQITIFDMINPSA